MNWSTDTPTLDAANSSEVVPVRFYAEDVTHELGADLTSEPIERSVRVPPSRGATVVTFPSHVASGVVAALRSAPYMATVRRRRAAAIRRQLESLRGQSQRPDFLVFVHPVVESLRQAIHELSEVETEGNSREMLRLIRDSLLDGGWEAYRNGEVRDVVGRLLNLLASSEEVTAADAHEAFEVLDEMGQLPLFPVLPDGEEKTAEIPD